MPCLPRYLRARDTSSLRSFSGCVSVCVGGGYRALAKVLRGASSFQVRTKWARGRSSERENGRGVHGCYTPETLHVIVPKRKVYFHVAWQLGYGHIYDVMHIWRLA